ncbi:MAG TPA: HD domain-containing protein [Solirubrobacteraceae bacterium]|jgi:3'-5' exoribonuclease|nr:HD domain-containing protein [Solirubrobacteraceae bacterium]
MQVRELQDGCRIETALLVQGVETRRRREGGGREDGEYLKLTLGDRTGSVPAVVLEEVDAARTVCTPGGVVHVFGSFETHPRFGGRVVVEAIREAGDGEYELQHLLDGPAHPAAQMESDLRELVATVQDPDLRRLLAAMFGEDSPTWARFREAPAAKHYHQAYRHGLLEHCLGVAQAVSAISATFPGIDRDVAVTGALLHDVGKLDVYELAGSAIEMSDQGRLYGEIALGYYRVRNMIESLDGFPAETAQAVLHIILSHHGSLEFGSPVIPCTREATLVHMIDNLGGRLGSFDRIEKALPAGAQWSAFDKGIGGGAYFAAPAVGQRRAA